MPERGPARVHRTVHTTGMDLPAFLIVPDEEQRGPPFLGLRTSIVMTCHQLKWVTHGAWSKQVPEACINLLSSCPVSRWCAVHAAEHASINEECVSSVQNRDILRSPARVHLTVLVPFMEECRGQGFLRLGAAFLYNPFKVTLVSNTSFSRSTVLVTSVGSITVANSLIAAASETSGAVGSEVPGSCLGQS